MKTVAILGAGPSGLVAAKEAIKNGLVPTIFEKQEELGGVWNPRSGAVWDTMHTNISKYTTVFGDTAYPEEEELFPCSGKVFKYLSHYAEEWGILKHIKFQCQVLRVEPIEGENGVKECEEDGVEWEVDNDQESYGAQGWKVTWSTSKGTHETQDFSGLIIATGIFAQKNIPEVLGISSFPGKILHSNQYKTGKDFKGLRVLTIGGSFSGAEIAADISNHCEKSYHSFTRPFWILRRFLPDKDRNKKGIPIDLLFYTRKFYSQPFDPLISPEQANVKKNLNMAAICQEQQEFEPLKISENDEIFKEPVNAVISDNCLPRIRSGKLIPIRGSISEIKGNQVIFTNGETIEDIDVIIFATGFAINNDFFPPDILRILQYQALDRLQPLILFQECVHPELRNLFFIGMYKGPYFAVMEQQARWAAKVLSGKIPLPPVHVMEDGLRKEQAIRHQVPRPQFPHSEFVLFADTISKFAHSFPDLGKLSSSNYTLTEALEGGSTVGSKPTSRRGSFIKPVMKPGELEEKQAIYQRFMSAPVTPNHYNLVKDYKKVMLHIDHVEEVINGLE